MCLMIGLLSHFSCEDLGFFALIEKETIGSARMVFNYFVIWLDILLINSYLSAFIFKLFK